MIPAGGNNVTSDISMGLRTPMAEAERLKRNAGCALGRMVADDEEIEVPGVGGHAPRKAARRVLSDIIEPLEVAEGTAKAILDVKAHSGSRRVSLCCELVAIQKLFRIHGSLFKLKTS